VARGIAGHNGWIINNTRNETWHLQGYPVHYSVFVRFLRFRLEFVVDSSLSSFSTLHWPLTTLPLHQPTGTRLFPHSMSRCLFSFLFCYLSAAPRNGMERNPQRCLRTSVVITCRRGPGWRDPTWVGPNNWESAPFLTAGRAAGLSTWLGVDRDGLIPGWMGWGRGPANKRRRGNRLSAWSWASLSPFRSALAFLSLACCSPLHFFLCTIRVDSWTIMSYLGIPLENHWSVCVVCV
jgi:hypothetical protein